MEEEIVNSGVGESADRITTVRREVIKKEKEISECADPSEKDDKYGILINMKLRQVKRMIEQSEEDGYDLENGKTLEEAERDYASFIRDLKMIRKPDVTSEPTMRGRYLATNIYIDNELYSCAYNDNSLEMFKNLAEVQAYERKCEGYALLDVRLNEYIDVGWDNDDSDSSMTADKLIGRVRNSA